MNNTIFEQLLTQFNHSPETPIPLPTDETTRETFFLEAKRHVLKLTNLGQIEELKACLAFVDTCVVQTDHSSIFQAWANWCHGLAWYNHNPLAALKHYEQAYQHYELVGKSYEAGRVLINYGLMLGRVGRLAEAENAIWRAYDYLEDYPSYEGWPALYVNLSDIQVRQGKYKQMLVSAHYAQKEAKRFGNLIVEGKALINQALAALFLGQLDSAQKTLKLARKYAIACNSPELEGHVLLNLARLQTYRSHLFEALRLLDQARNCFTAAQLTLDQASADIDEAALYQQLGMLKEAREAAVRAADAFEGMQPNDSIEARLLALRLALARKETRKATTYLQQARLLLPQTANSFQALWQAYQAHPLLQKKGVDWQGALAQADQATAQLEVIGAAKEQLEAALIAAALASALQRPDVRERYQQIITLAHQRGFPSIEQEACEALAEHQPPAQAIQSLQRALGLAREIRHKMPLEELKANLLTGQSMLFSRLIEACLDSQQPLLACQVLLEAKGAIWAELASTSEAITPDPAWIRAKAQLAFWQKELSDAAPNSPYKNYCITQLEQTEVMLQRLARRESRSRAIQPLPQLSVVQTTLSATSVAIEYLVSKTTIWACIIKANQPPQWIKVARTSSVARLLRRLNPLRGDLANRPPEQRFMAAQAQQATIDKLLKRLYDQLLGPLAHLLSPHAKLLIAPHNFLFEVPWAALRHQNRYLVEQYDLSLLPSIALAAIPYEEATAKACPDSCGERVAPLALGYAADLHHIEAELHAIQQALPTFRSVYPAYLADMPTDEAPRYLHIAAHGQINRQSPLLSSIQLADQPFLLAETFNLSLQGTELVTLSACETGTTPERGGVALALAGAFLTAGAQAVLASLWRVDDEATSVLMSHLYQQLSQNKSLPQALAHAQRHLMAQGFQHPYYWAAFQSLSRKVA